MKTLSLDKPVFEKVGKDRNEKKRTEAYLRLSSEVRDTTGSRLESYDSLAFER